MMLIFNITLIYYIDIDECSNPVWNECEQTCQNTIGGYTCGCRTGFTKHNDTNCNGNKAKHYINKTINLPLCVTSDNWLCMCCKLFHAPMVCLLTLL